VTLASEYAHSSELVVVKQVGEWRLTKGPKHPEHTVWHRGTIVATGSDKLATRVFTEKAMSEETPGTDLAVNEQTAAVTSEVAHSPAAPKVVDIDTRVGQYIRLRDKIKEQDDAHKEKMRPAREALEKLNSIMLEYLQSVKVDSASTGSGTVYRTMKKSATIADGDAFMRHVIGNEEWELMDKKANATAVEAFIEENGVAPPGVNYSVTAVVGVRRK